MIPKTRDTLALPGFYGAVVHYTLLEYGVQGNIAASH